MAAPGERLGAWYRFPSVVKALSGGSGALDKACPSDPSATTMLLCKAIADSAAPTKLGPRPGEWKTLCSMVTLVDAGSPGLPSARTSGPMRLAYTTLLRMEESITDFNSRP